MAASNSMERTHKWKFGPPVANPLQRFDSAPCLLTKSKPSPLSSSTNANSNAPKPGPPKVPTQSTPPKPKPQKPVATNGTRGKKVAVYNPFKDPSILPPPTARLAPDEQLAYIIPQPHLAVISSGVVRPYRVESKLEDDGQGVVYRVKERGNGKGSIGVSRVTLKNVGKWVKDVSESEEVEEEDARTDTSFISKSDATCGSESSRNSLSDPSCSFMSVDTTTIAISRTNTAANMSLNLPFEPQHEQYCLDDQKLPDRRDHFDGSQTTNDSLQSSQSSESDNSQDSYVKIVRMDEDLPGEPLYEKNVGEHRRMPDDQDYFDQSQQTNNTFSLSQSTVSSMDTIPTEDIDFNFDDLEMCSDAGTIVVPSDRIPSLGPGKRHKRDSDKFPCSLAKRIRLFPSQGTLRIMVLDGHCNICKHLQCRRSFDLGLFASPEPTAEVIQRLEISTNTKEKETRGYQAFNVADSFGMEVWDSMKTFSKAHFEFSNSYGCEARVRWILETCVVGGYVESGQMEIAFAAARKVSMM